MFNQIINHDAIKNNEKKIAEIVLDCYGLNRVESNYEITYGNEEYTSWYIEGIEKEDLIAQKLTDEEIIKLYFMAI